MSEDITLISCLTPLVVFSLLAFCKLCCFKIKNLGTWLLISLSFAMLYGLFYYRFGTPQKVLPLYIMAMPMSLFLFACVCS